MRGAVGARTAATAATANAAAAVIWNPHASLRPRIYLWEWLKTVATADFLAIVRATARGTATTTVTPTIVNETDRAVAPPSGLVVDTAWSVAPTLEGTSAPLWRGPMGAAVGAGFSETMPEEWEIPPGAGLAFITPVATILQPADLNFRWAE